ncbi:MAG: PEP-CTERM sorting domain-containing protein [Fimbriimonadaceae bacterium]
MKIKSLLVLATMFAVASANAYQIDVYASAAPNAFGSANWGGYVSNALTAIEGGLGTYGAAGPTQFNNYAGETHLVSENIATGYTSWLGNANPSAPFNNELGTRWHFGVRVLGQGSQFTLQNLTYNMTSVEQPSLNFSGNFVGATYSPTRYGIDYVDGIKGNGNDIIYSTGNGTTLVDELVYVGVGNAFASYVTDPGATNQDKLDGVVASIAGYTLTTQYGLDFGAGNVATGSAFTNFQAVPEPATMSLIGLGALALIRKKRKS